MEELSRKHCKTDGPDAPSIAILAPGKPEPGLENLDTATKACDGVTSKEILMEQGGLAPIRRAEDDTAGAYAHDNASHSISSDDQVQDLDQNLAVVSPDQETQRPLSNGDSSKIESDLEVLTASPASTHVSSQCADVLDWDLSEVNTLQVLTEACNKYYTEASDEDSKYASDEGSDEESERCRTSDSLRTNLPDLCAPDDLYHRRLNSTMSSVFWKDKHNKQSQVFASDSATLSTMSSVYGARSLYRRRNSGATQCTKSSGPEIPAPFNTAIDEELRQCRTSFWNMLPETLEQRSAVNGRLLLESAESGNWVRVSGLLRAAGRPDINYKSRASNGRTALMIAISHNHYDVADELLHTAIHIRELPLLSHRDNDGSTLIDLAAASGNETAFREFMEHVVAVCCCTCSRLERRGSICEWIVNPKKSDRCGLVLEGPVKYPLRAECSWGRRLQRQHWLQSGSLKEIDDLALQCKDEDDMSQYFAEWERRLCQWPDLDQLQRSGDRKCQRWYEQIGAAQ